MKLETSKVEQNIYHVKCQNLKMYDPQDLKLFIEGIPLTEENKIFVDQLNNINSDEFLAQIAGSSHLNEFLRQQVLQRIELESKLVQKKQEHEKRLAQFQTHQSMLKKLPAILEDMDVATVPLKMFFQSNGLPLITDSSNIQEKLPVELKRLYLQLVRILDHSQVALV